MKNSLRFILSVFTILTLSCGSGGLTFSELKNADTKVETKVYESSVSNYKISIPLNWALTSISESEGHFEETFSDSILNQKMQASNFPTMTIGTFTSGSNSLKTSFDSILSEFKNGKPIEVVESGMTGYLRYESYFIHYKSSPKIPIQKFEGFSFIIKGKEDFTYFGINLTSPQYNKKELKDNLAKMLSCIKTFEYGSNADDSRKHLIDSDSLKKIIHENPNCTLTLYNDLAQMVLKMDSVNGENIEIELSNTDMGLYYYDVEAKGEIISEGMLTIRR